MRSLREAAIAVSVALHCWRHGHDWHTNRPTRCTEVVSCRWCGEMRGYRVNADPEHPCRWFRPTMLRPVPQECDDTPPTPDQPAQGASDDTTER